MDIYDMFDEMYYKETDNIVEEEEELISGKELEKMREASNVKIPMGLDNDIEEELIHFKRYNKNRREHKYTEQEMELIRESCKETIVHDYSENDIYHMSDEDRSKHDSLQELSLKLSSLKRVYRKIDQYIEAQRIVFDAWCLIESKENQLFSKDEFFQMIHDGKIYSNRIIQPQYKGKIKYDPDIIIAYISNKDLDPKNLVIQNKARDGWYDYDEEDDETEEEKMYRLLSPEEVQYILDYDDNNPAKIEAIPLEKKYLKNLGQRTFGKKKKKESYQVESAHEILNKIQANHGDYSSRSFMSGDSMFDINESRIDYSKFRYTGSLRDKAGLKLFNMRMDLARDEMRIPGSSYMTYGDKDRAELYKDFENKGGNSLILRRSLDGFETHAQVDAKQQKEKNRKMEGRVVDRLIKLNDNPKFKKLTSKAEKDLNEYFDERD